jgi:D-alanyl-D-alanine dipeptidase
MKKIIPFFVFGLMGLKGLTQTQTPSTPIVISKIREYKKKILANPSLKMVELQKIIPNIKYELHYATTDNFTKVRLYPKNLTKTFLRKKPAEALAEAAKELSTMGIGFKIWDAYRPYSVTQKFWKLIHDERYVANPAKGSGHNRGIAIDLTLIDLKTGEELNMPTKFDDFSEKAHHGFQHLSPIQIKNREILKSTMEKHGFLKFQTEWWHYYWPNGNDYDVLDLSFSKLK